MTAKDYSRRRTTIWRSVTARPLPTSPRRRPSRSPGDQQRKRGLYAAAVAKELSDACGGLCTPALRSPASQPLTGRQREIVELVVAGLSNREIADRL